LRLGCVPPVSLMGVVPRQVINGLKQRVLKLEQQCKEKDNIIKYGARGAGGPCLGASWARAPVLLPAQRRHPLSHPSPAHVPASLVTKA
jgi:hypothetical protein